MFIGGYFQYQKAMSHQKFKSGAFSTGLMSLQVQLKGLLEGAGGDNAVELLDTLSTLSSSEQKIALEIFTRVLDRVGAQDERFLSESDKEMKELEDLLFDDIMHAMADAAGNESQPIPAAATKKKLSVVDGGKSSSSFNVRKIEVSSTVTPIDFEKARKNRKNTRPNFLN